ncbi:MULTISPECIES: hypothetical protein [unclassified Streptomyces]|uniref:hypothetical protein n=1 Tax=unclassified Streptomyces TaxID=2593676 RepID=UPI0006FAF76C|nr:MULTISPECIES: hypothetical protein [unclassified Streptomyces]KQX53080.1 hypothetical protein ASD33_07625 [Streptomyces sp. Root1304]KRA90001.1 hypothetical protein ASE09_07630 [Streptomyces sp. Root66D1]
MILFTQSGCATDSDDSAHAAPTKPALDVCALATEEEVGAVLGQPAKGRRDDSALPGRTQCTYVNAAAKGRIVFIALLPFEVNRQTKPGTLPVAGVGDVALYDEASIGGHLYVRKGSVNFAVNYAFDPLAPGIPAQPSSQIRDRLETLARAIVSRL